ncbi:MAG: M48 family metallopeptidase [Desulfobacteraceae bacterium]|nr:M48 family metallopeptidase [Desulfobacteraceae bacterium]
MALQSNHYFHRWLLLSIVLIMACATVPITGRESLQLVSNSELASMADQQYSDTLKKSKLSSDSANAAMVRKVGMKIANVGLLLPYSRLQESEADRIGLVLMAMAGYDPREAIPFWQRMSQEGGSRPPELLSTHPAPQTRIADIQRYLPEALPYYEKARSKGRFQPLGDGTHPANGILQRWNAKSSLAHYGILSADLGSDFNNQNRITRVPPLRLINGDLSACARGQARDAHAASG